MTFQKLKYKTGGFVRMELLLNSIRNAYHPTMSLEKINYFSKESGFHELKTEI